MQIKKRKICSPAGHAALCIATISNTNNEKRLLLAFKPPTHFLCEATGWVSPLALLPLFHPSLLSKIFALRLLTSLVLLPFLFVLPSPHSHPPLLPPPGLNKSALSPLLSAAWPFSRMCSKHPKSKSLTITIYHHINSLSVTDDVGQPYKIKVQKHFCGLVTCTWMCVKKCPV